MKFKIAVIGFLIAILSVNVFTAYTIIQEEKKQTDSIDAIIEVKMLEYGYAGRMDYYDILRERNKTN